LVEHHSCDVLMLHVEHHERLVGPGSPNRPELSTGHVAAQHGPDPPTARSLVPIVRSPARRPMIDPFLEAPPVDDPGSHDVAPGDRDVSSPAQQTVPSAELDPNAIHRSIDRVADRSNATPAPVLGEPAGRSYSLTRI